MNMKKKQRIYSNLELLKLQKSKIDRKSEEKQNTYSSSPEESTDSIDGVLRTWNRKEKYQIQANLEDDTNRYIILSGKPLE